MYTECSAFFSDLQNLFIAVQRISPHMFANHKCICWCYNEIHSTIRCWVCSGTCYHQLAMFSIRNIIAPKRARLECLCAKILSSNNNTTHCSIRRQRREAEQRESKKRKEATERKKRTVFTNPIFLIFNASSTQRRQRQRRERSIK